MNRLLFAWAVVGSLQAQTVANADAQQSPPAIVTEHLKPSEAPSAPVRRALVKGIVSASSVQVDSGGSTVYLRLACVDAEPGNSDGSAVLRSLIDGKVIEYSPATRDTVEVGIDGVNVGLKLLRSGLAKLTPSEACLQSTDYKAAADEARVTMAGLYAAPVREEKFDVTRFVPDVPDRPGLGKILFGVAVAGLAEGLAEGLVDRAFGTSDVYVNGYYRRNGGYVAPHHRTHANGIKADNYSTKGNTNPYTGKRGTK